MTPINGLPAIDVTRSDSSSTTSRAAQSGQPDFVETLRSTLASVEQAHSEAQARVSAMVQGTGEDVHTAAIAVEKADLAFQLMLQVRNKIVQAYQEVSRMPF